MGKQKHSVLGDYYALTKPRIVFMVLVTVTWGFYLGRQASVLAMLVNPIFWATMLGTGLAAAGGAVLNQYLERDHDRGMARTCDRPLPAGRIQPMHALVYGLWLALAGLGILLAWVNLVTAFLVLLTNFLYVLVYTPMKRVSALNTTFGAIPGAMPPLIGWTAAYGAVSTEGVLLFLILFVWQHPHVYAITWMYRDDFARAGFRMLSLHDDGRRTSRGVWFGTLSLVAVSVLPAVWGSSGLAYLAVALAMGGVMLIYGRRLTRACTVEAARKVMFASIVYLPIILAGILIDSWL